MSHDGGPSLMYWVFWTVFQNSQTFPGFPGIPVGPALLQLDLEGFWVVWTLLDITGHHWMSLDVTGCNWRSLDVWQACLGVPGHLVLGKCRLASPVGARSVKLMAGQGLM